MLAREGALRSRRSGPPMARPNPGSKAAHDRARRRASSRNAVPCQADAGRDEIGVKAHLRAMGDNLGRDRAAPPVRRRKDAHAERRARRLREKTRFQIRGVEFVRPAGRARADWNNRGSPADSDASARREAPTGRGKAVSAGCVIDPPCAWTASSSSSARTSASTRAPIGGKVPRQDHRRSPRRWRFRRSVSRSRPRWHPP